MVRCVLEILSHVLPDTDRFKPRCSRRIRRPVTRWTRIPAYTVPQILARNHEAQAYLMLLAQGETRFWTCVKEQKITQDHAPLLAPCPVAGWRRNHGATVQGNTPVPAALHGQSLRGWWRVSISGPASHHASSALRLMWNRTLPIMRRRRKGTRAASRAKHG